METKLQYQSNNTPARCHQFHRDCSLEEREVLPQIYLQNFNSTKSDTYIAFRNHSCLPCTNYYAYSEFPLNPSTYLSVSQVHSKTLSTKCRRSPSTTFLNYPAHRQTHTDILGRVPSSAVGLLQIVRCHMDYIYIYNIHIVAVMLTRTRTRTKPTRTRRRTRTRLKDKDKDFTYSYLLQVAAKPKIAIKQQQ